MSKKLDCRLKINKSKKSCLKNKQKNKTKVAYNNLQKVLTTRINEIMDKEEKINNLQKQKAKKLNKTTKSSKSSKLKKSTKKSTKKSIKSKNLKRKPCPKGSRRNSITGRCRKVKSNKTNKSNKLNKSNKSNKLKKSDKKSTKIECYPEFVTIYPSGKSDKKYMAIFTNNDKSKVKTIHFGAYGMSDYTTHKDKDRKERYLNRHKKRENWNKCDTAGALSRWLLWNKPTLKDSFKDYAKKFNLKYRLK